MLKIYLFSDRIVKVLVNKYTEYSFGGGFF